MRHTWRGAANNNPTECFETFPFPESSAEQSERIAEAARELDRLRTGWLNPPEWTREEVLEFYSRRLGARPVGSLRPRPRLARGIGRGG